VVLRDAVAMIAGGMAIGLPCVAALGRLVESQLFGITPTDPRTIAADDRAARGDRRGGGAGAGLRRGRREADRRAAR